MIQRSGFIETRFYYIWYVGEKTTSLKNYSHLDLKNYKGEIIFDIVRDEIKKYIQDYRDIPELKEPDG